MMMRKYFQDYNSDEDESYNPTRKEEAEYRQEHERKGKQRVASLSAQQLYQQTKEEYRRSTERKIPEEAPSELELAHRILNSDSMRQSKKVVFAGKEFLLNEETGQLEIVEKVATRPQAVEKEATEEEIQRRHMEISYHYLNHVMRAIYNRSRKINSVGKSKLDWGGFVKQEGIADQLKYNRKGGLIQNMEFLRKRHNNQPQLE